ncbi:MAG: hypothetical protein LDL14_04000 [Nitrospira sp.]|nr:hypothetical protein [Nitrospira sp.]
MRQAVLKLLLDFFPRVLERRIVARKMDVDVPQCLYDSVEDVSWFHG